MKKMLFLCVANSARSQIAEGLARKMLAGQAEVQSAGSIPSGKVNPLAVAVMQEIGIDISSHTSKGIDNVDEQFLDTVDYIITLCAEEVCPIVLSKARKLQWPNSDPAGVTGTLEEQLQAFRVARDNIARQISEFKANLVAA